MIRKLLFFFIAASIGLSSGTLYATNQTSPTVVKNKDYKLSKTKLVKYKLNQAKKTTIRQRIRVHKFSSIFVDSYDGSGPLKLASAKALVFNQLTGETLYAKNISQPTPIASVTKLMTAMVMLDAHLPMDEVLVISNDDVDYLKGTHSRLGVGTSLTRGEFLQLALMSSENRAAAALARNYPGGITAFIAAMNSKAHALSMKSTNFLDATGLSSSNVSTAEDLVKMVTAAYNYPEIRQVTTTASQAVTLYGKNNPINFVNTNALVRAGNWLIGLSKTGFINEAGRCLVMQAEISGQPMIIVLLNSEGKLSRIGDANRIRKWIEYNGTSALAENING